MITQCSDYECWNRTLAEYCLLSEDNDNQAYLTVSPNILAAAWNQIHTEVMEAREAEKSFVCAVSEMYRRDVKRFGLSWLSRFGQDGLPRSIAFLGLSVLATLKMEEDDEHAAHNYYSRLEGVLGLEGDDFNRNSNREEFKALWHQLGQWLKEERQLSMAFPTRQEGPYHIPLLPLSQAPFRRVDLEKLPSFFSSFQYQANGITSRTKLRDDLITWGRSNHLTTQGLDALQDDRCNSVLAQVEQELGAWDGTIEVAGARWAQIELQLNFPGRKPRVYLLPHRPCGFPERFEASERGFEAGDDGWYEPVELLRDEGRLLRANIDWLMTYAGRQLALHRNEAAVIAFAESSFLSGYLSRLHLPLQINCAVLCRVDLTSKVKGYLYQITEQDHQPEPLLEGWNLFRNVRPVRQLMHIEEVLKPIDVQTEMQILTVGGLRLGRREWLAGVPPRILIAGKRQLHERAAINGTMIEISEEGALIEDGLFHQPGRYEITIGRANAVNIDIIEPKLAPEFREAEGGKWFCAISASNLVVLPPGNWTLLGTATNEVRHCNHHSFNGIITNTPFRAVWAINRQPGASVKIICLTVPPPPPQTSTFSAQPSNLLSGAHWATTILSATSLRPRFACLTEFAAIDLRQAWQAYLAAAVNQQRQMRQQQRRRR